MHHRVKRKSVVHKSELFGIVNSLKNNDFFSDLLQIGLTVSFENRSKLQIYLANTGRM
jgi:hypothetical protein